MSFNVKYDHLASALVPRGIAPWIGLVALMALIQAVPDAASWSRYDRDAIGAGELWRIVTANFIHLGWPHLVLNATGLLAIGWLFAEDYSVRQWAFILLLCSIASSVGLWFLTPEIGWCVGLSGALHGLFSAGAVAWIRDGVSLGYWLLLGEAAKLAYEQTLGAMPFSEGVVGGAVVTDAHLWGAFGGVAAGFLVGWWRKRDARL